VGRIRALTFRVVIRSYDTPTGAFAQLRLVGDDDNGYNEQEVVTVPVAASVEPDSAKTPVPGKGPIRSYSFALSPESKVDLVFHGEITEDSLKALRDYVDITVRVLGGLKENPKP
jgi:hypothetical protein